MVGFFAVCIAIYLTGDAIARRLCRESGTAERIAASSVIGIALWIAILWSLAIAHQLNRRNLIAAVIAFGIAALWSLRGIRLPRISRWAVAVVLPVALWTLFILWRSTVVPPQNHDAMTYHLPKAVLMLQAEGFERFATPDMRIVAFPSNYELLLTSLFILDRSDQLTEWIGTAFYLLFLVCVAMIAERWWGGGPHVTAAVLAAAGMPLLLLHSGADKNDVMTAVFGCCALFWGAQWCITRGSAALILATLSGALAIGTKLTAAGIAPAIAPFVIFAIVRRHPRPRHVLLTMGFALVAFLLLGGWVFVSNAIASSLLHYEGEDLIGGVPVARIAAWEHLWQLPHSLVRVSLGLHAAVSWPRHNVINSHFGVLFGLSVLLLPIAIWRLRSEGDDALRNQRLIGTAAAVLSVAVLLPLVPRHTFAATARYTILLVPFFLGWSIGLLHDLSSRMMRLIVAALLLIFGVEAADIARHDTFVTPSYLRWAASHRGTRHPNQYTSRAATYADDVAGPSDTIAFLGGGDGWLYPLYGRSFQRRVHHLPYAAGVRDVPADAQWLVIDRAPAIPGEPSKAADVRLMNEALASGEFRSVYYNRMRNQVVLQRRAP